MPERPAVIVMAKLPRPGRVKTRLTVGRLKHAPLTREQAAAVHAALLGCVIARLGVFLNSGRARGILALDDPIEFSKDPEHVTLRQLAEQVGFAVTDQGYGDLGQRLEHVWSRHCPHATGLEALNGATTDTTDPPPGPAVFFGVDSPDLPTGHLEAALHVADGSARTHDGTTPSSDAAVGPVGDGGYWCLAARRYTPALLRGIDWGTPAVYDQTHAAARSAGLPLTDLPPWHDVDTPADLAALRRRLRALEPDRTDPPLRRLADTLNGLLGPMP